VHPSLWEVTLGRTLRTSATQIELDPTPPAPAAVGWMSLQPRSSFVFSMGGLCAAGGSHSESELLKAETSFLLFDPYSPRVMGS